MNSSNESTFLSTNSTIELIQPHRFMIVENFTMKQKKNVPSKDSKNSCLFSEALKLTNTYLKKKKRLKVIFEINYQFYFIAPIRRTIKTDLNNFIISIDIESRIDHIEKVVDEYKEKINQKIEHSDETAFKLI